MRLLTTLAASAVLASFVGAQSDKLVIEAGRIVTQAGDDIENGVIVIENGRIKAIGAADDIDKPWDAPVVGGPDLVAFPGFVEAHSDQGLDRSNRNENVDVAPFLDIRDSIDPVGYFYEDCLRYGITTVNVQQGANCVIGARGMIVRPVGLTVEEMMVRPAFGMKISASPKSRKSRATQMQVLRQTFDNLERYLAEMVQKEQDERGHAEREALYQGRELEGEEAKGRGMEGLAWTVDGLEVVPRGALDPKQRPLLDLVEGRVAVFLYCGAPVDVPNALDIARENGFLARTTLVIDESCWRAADLIAEAGVPVVLDGDLMDVRRDPITGEETETFVPGVLREKGIRFALASGDSSTHSLWYQAALAVGHGLERQEALDAVTTTPAEIIGMGDQVGSLEVGKMGNVVLLSGDPLSITSWVEYVVIEGAEVYDRSKDVRNKHLLDGTQPAGSAFSTGDPDGSEGHDHDADSGDDHDAENGDEEEDR